MIFHFLDLLFVWVGTHSIFQFAVVPAPVLGFFTLWGGFCKFFVVE